MKLYSYTFHRPVPDRIHLKDVTKTYDIYNLDILKQIHATLFKIDHTSNSNQYLVKTFRVSEDSLTYKFTLKNMLFHDNTKLNSEIVLKNIEYYIKHKIQTYEKLFSIDGAKEFSIEKMSKIKGIVLDKNDSLSFSIILKYPDPKLIYKLADINLSILKPNRDPNIGLGEYKIDRISKDCIFFSKFKNINENSNFGPERIIYYLNVNKADAISGLIEGKYDDLPFYVLSQEEQENLKPYVNFTTLYSPKNYVFVINSKRIKNKKDRIKILTAIDWDKLRDKCYANNTRAYSFIPPGFMGYKEKPSIQTEKYFKQIYSNKVEFKKKIKKNYKILITMNIGSEHCVKNYFKAAGEKYLGWQVGIAPTFDVVNAWQNNQIDAMFLWFEDKSQFSFWSYFNPKSSFLMGDPNDHNFMKIYEKFDKANDLIEEEIIARKIDDHIISLATAFPVFHPTVNVAYSKRFILSEFGDNFAYSIPFSYFVLKP